MKKFLYIIVAFVLAFSPALVFGTNKNTKQTSIRKEKRDSLAILTEKATKGDAVSQNILGVWYYTGKNVKQDYKIALDWWAKSAKQDNPDAIGNMAMCYQLGNGIKKDSVMALSLYKAAIKKGNTSIIPQHEQIVKNTKSLFSTRLLMECYQNGIGIKRDLNQAEKYQEALANAGDSEQQFSFALKCLNSKRAEKAAKYFEKASKSGKKEAVYYYGYLLFNGMGIDQDKVKGLALMTKAAKQNLVAAQYQVGRAYFEGNGVEKNLAEAQKYLSEAAGKNKNAAWLLGKSYLELPTPNLYFASQWISESVKGHEKEVNTLLADSKYKVFHNYVAGLKKYYLDKDFAGAIKLFKEVEKHNGVEGITMQATCWANKDNKKRNAKKAVSLYKKAVEKGSAAASYYLSSMYEVGEGMKQADKEQALSLLKDAAKGGVAYAQDKLGDKYFSGDRVAQDYTEAAKLYLKAEAQNRLTTTAAKNLAQCYARGIKVLPDLADAKNRMEQLNKYKASNSLVDMLKLLEE